MRLIFKVLICLTGAILAAPLVAFAVYDLREFQPRIAEIRSLVANAAPAERTPPGELIRVVRVAQPEPNLSAHVARLLVYKLNAVPTEGGMSQSHWHVTSALWWTLVSLHLTEDERLTLSLNLSHMGSTGDGYANASSSIVGQPLDRVTLEQAATLVTVARMPSYLDDRERLRHQSALLVERVKNAR